MRCETARLQQSWNGWNLNGQMGDLQADDLNQTVFSGRCLGR